MTDESPDRIWLQLHGDEPPEARDGPVDYRIDEITWCWEPMFEYDIEYIRADLAAERERELVEALEHVCHVHEMGKWAHRRAYEALAKVEEQTNE